MKKEQLALGKELADESLKWHRSTMPFPDEYVEEAIPKLIKWLKQFAFPELERHDDTAKAAQPEKFASHVTKKTRAIVNDIAADNLRDHVRRPGKKEMKYPTLEEAVAELKALDRVNPDIGTVEVSLERYQIVLATYIRALESVRTPVRARRKK